MGCLLGIPITNSGKLVLIGQMVKTSPTAPAMHWSDPLCVHLYIVQKTRSLLPSEFWRTRIQEDAERPLFDPMHCAAVSPAVLHNGLSPQWLHNGSFSFVVSNTIDHHAQLHMFVVCTTAPWSYITSCTSSSEKWNDDSRFSPFQECCRPAVH